MGNLAGIKCDGCGNQVLWEPNKIKEDASAFPDAAFRIINFVPFADVSGGGKVFCGKFCLLEHLKKYENPKSPAELAREAQKNAPIPIDRKKADVPVLPDYPTPIVDSLPDAPDQGDPVA